MDDFRQLRQLVTLAECRNLGTAAEKLGITKSAISQTLKRQEDIYGVPLFTRDRRGVQPTPFGDLLIDAVRRALQMLEQVHREFDQMRNLQMGRLIVGCDPALSDGLVAGALADLVTAYPKLRFSIRTGAWNALQNELDERQIDLFIGVRPDIDVRGYAIREFLMPPIIVYCRPGHPLTQKSKVTFADCYRYPVIGPYLPDWCFELIFRSSGEPSLSADRVRDILLESASGGAVREVVRRSDAISGDFLGAIESEVKAGLLQLLPIVATDVDRGIKCIIITEERRALSPAATLLIEAVCARASEMVRRETGSLSAHSQV